MVLDSRAPLIVVDVLQDVVGPLHLLQLGPDCLQGCYLTPGILLVLITGQPHLLHRHRLSRLVADSPLGTAGTTLLLADWTQSQNLLVSGVSSDGRNLCSLSWYSADLGLHAVGMQPAEIKHYE